MNVPQYQRWPGKPCPKSTDVVSLCLERRRSLVKFPKIVRAGGWNSLRGCEVKRMKAVSGESCHDFYKKFHHAEKDVRGTTHRGHMSPGRFFLLWLFCFSSVQRFKHLFSPRERSQDRRVRWRLNSKYCIWLIMVLKQNRWDQGQHWRCWHWTRDRAFILWPWRQRGREGTEEHEFLWGEEGQEVEVVHTWWRKVRSYIQRQAVGQRKTGTRMGANSDQIQRLMNKVESGPAEAEGHECGEVVMCPIKWISSAECSHLGIEKKISDVDLRFFSWKE